MRLRVLLGGVVLAGCVGDAANQGADAGDATTADVADVVQQQDVAANDAPSDAGAFTPAVFGTRLVTWLDVTKDVSVSAGRVTAWKDQSGHNNDAVQTQALNQPTLTVDAGKLGAVTFNAPDASTPIYLVIADSQSLHFGTGDWTIAIVTRHTNPLGTYGALWTKADEVSPGTCPCRGSALFANTKSPAPATNFAAQVASVGFDASAIVESNDAGYNDGNFHMVIARRTGITKLEIRVDGIPTTNPSVPPVDDSADGAAVGIGAGATGFSGNVGTSQLLFGDIAEIVAVQGTVTDPEMAQLETYLKSKYAL